MKNKLIAIGLAAAMLLALPMPVSPRLSEASAETEWYAQIVTLVNIERAAQGLTPLVATDAQLNSAAQVRAEELTVVYDPNHLRPDGQEWLTVLDEQNVVYWSAGENIAAGQKSPEEVMEGWMNSPPHRENILNPDWEHVGVGIAVNPDGYMGYGTYWVQLFSAKSCPACGVDGCYYDCLHGHEYCPICYKTDCYFDCVDDNICRECYQPKTDLCPECLFCIECDDENEILHCTYCDYCELCVTFCYTCEMCNDCCGEYYICPRPPVVYNCNITPDDPCKNCEDCGFVGGRYGFGRVLYGRDPEFYGSITMVCALAILRLLVGLKNEITGDPDALAAACITNPGADRPVMADALAILRYLVKLPSALDKYLLSEQYVT
ncbi:MAG: CAP domain-containing protein [Oscillospiraceae bacterium]|nr:CAP domain-containing protein [Oscillospiraceae bacterium]